MYFIGPRVIVDEHLREVRVPNELGRKVGPQSGRRWQLIQEDGLLSARLVDRRKQDFVPAEKFSRTAAA